MSQHVKRTPQARRDLSEIAAYIAQDNLSAALRFLDAAEATFASLLNSPELGNIGEFHAARLKGKNKQGRFNDDGRQFDSASGPRLQLRFRRPLPSKIIERQRAHKLIQFRLELVVVGFPVLKVCR